MKPEDMNFIRFGGREKPYKKLGVAPKAQLLNLAVRAGLPVPNGIVILDGVWARLQEWGVMAVDGEDVHVTNGAFLLEVMALHQLKRSVVVRRAFSEQGSEGPQHSGLPVAPDDPERLIRTLIATWQSGAEQTTRRDMLVMEYVAAKCKGHVQLGIGDSADSATIIDWSTEQTTTIALPQLSRWQRPTAAQPVARRLQQLLRGVRRSFGRKHIARIEWVDDGKVCWLVRLDHADAPE